MFEHLFLEVKLHRNKSSIIHVAITSVPHTIIYQYLGVLIVFKWLLNLVYWLFLWNGHIVRLVFWSQSLAHNLEYFYIIGLFSLKIGWTSILHTWPCHSLLPQEPPTVKLTVSVAHGGPKAAIRGESIPAEQKAALNMGRKPGELWRPWPGLLEEMPPFLAAIPDRSLNTYGLPLLLRCGNGSLRNTGCVSRAVCRTNFLKRTITICTPLSCDLCSTCLLIWW